MSRTLLTPQGDGNKISRYFTVGEAFKSRTLLTPQGDGNTGMVAAWCSSVTGRSRTLLTPQGDGNVDIPLGQVGLNIKQVPHPPYPARGRKRTSLEAAGQPDWLRPAPSLPRKGTETQHYSPCRREIPTVPHPPYPARGRKLLTASTVSAPKTSVPHPPYPARGRKHGIC